MRKLAIPIMFLGFIVAIQLSEAGTDEPLFLDAQLVSNGAGSTIGRSFRAEVSLGEPIVGLSQGQNHRVVAGFLIASYSQTQILAISLPLILLLIAIYIRLKKGKACKVQELALIGVIGLSVFCSPVQAQIGSSILSYQGRLMNSDGMIAPDGDDYTIEISFYESEAGGTTVFLERHEAVKVRNGLFVLLIGSETGGGIPGTIFSGPSQLYVQLGVGRTSIGGPLDLLEPRLPLTKTAQSFFADNSKNALLLQGSPASQFLKRSGGTMTGLLTLSGDPTGQKQAATKKYVDSQCRSAVGNNCKVIAPSMIVAPLVSSLQANDSLFGASNYVGRSDDSVVPVTSAGVLSNLFVYRSQFSSSPGSHVTIFVRLNGADTPLHVEFESSDGTVMKSNKAESIVVKQGDRVSFRFQNSGNVNDGGTYNAAVEFRPSDSSL